MIEQWREIVEQIPSRHLTGDLLLKPQGARAALARFASATSNLRYLEVGCRLGHSLALVAMTAKSLNEARVVDMWIANYGEEPNPGPLPMLNNLSALGVDTSKIKVQTGNSVLLLPTFAHMEFDLILVDGDHTISGAKADLMNCAPLLAPGGLLVFDDAEGALLDIWEEVMIVERPGLSLEEDHSANPPWCGARRMKE